MKKLLSWGLTVVVVLACCLTIPQGQGKAQSLQFQDLKDSSTGYGYAYNFVSYLTSHNVIHGYTSNGKSYFKPGNPITREQAAIMLVKALGDGPSKTTKPYFKDVGPSNSAFGYIQKAKELGIFQGHPDGSFGPNDELDRLQMAYAISNAFKLAPVPDKPSGFNDVSTKDPGYAQIEALYYDGFSHGNNGNYLPGNSITRAAFSVFVARGMDASQRLEPQLATGVVNVDTSSYLNVHTSPQISAVHIGGLTKGQKVAIYGESNQWYKIIYNGKWGYVSKSFVDKMTSGSSSNATCSNSNNGSSHVASVSACTPTPVQTSDNIGSNSTSNSSQATPTNSGTSTNPAATGASTGTSAGSTSTPTNSGTSTNPAATGASTGASAGSTSTPTNSGTSTNPAATGASTGTSAGSTSTPANSGTSTGNAATDTSTGTSAGSTSTPANSGTSTGNAATGTSTGASAGSTSTPANSVTSTGTAAAGTNAGTSAGSAPAPANSGTGTAATDTSTGASAGSTTTTAPLDMSKPLANKVIVIDPGHGGIDPGTSSNGIDEKTITLEVGLDLKPLLQSLGATVYFTRTADTSVSLADRVALAKKVNADMFLSIHCNSANPLAYGVETYYDTKYNPLPDDSVALSGDIEKGIVDATHTYNRGNRPDTDLYDIGLYVLRENSVPAALTELGFLSNANDRLMLTTPQFQQIYAQGIKNGIVNYFNSK